MRSQYPGRYHSRTTTLWRKTKQHSLETGVVRVRLDRVRGVRLAQKPVLAVAQLGHLVELLGAANPELVGPGLADQLVGVLDLGQLVLVDFLLAVLR